MSTQPTGQGGTAARIERFRAWLEAYAQALEDGDPVTAASLFVLGATYRPDPFATGLSGRPAIQAHLEALIAERPGMLIRARALGMGSTYGVAHWVAAWPAADGGDDQGVSDGLLLVAFDPLGRCTSLREWSITGVRHADDDPLMPS